MNLERLIRALQSSGADPHVEDLLDALWLATRGLSIELHGAEPTPLQNPERPRGQVEPRTDDATPEGRPAAGGRVAQDPILRETKGQEKPAPVFAPGVGGLNDSPISASPVSLPAGYALARKLKLSRALRPFRQRRPSDHEVELDEERTATLTAELGGRLQPAYRPVMERWFDVEVVLEDDDAIGLWRDTLRELCQVMRDTGAFRNVRLWRLRMPEGRDPFLEQGGEVRIAAAAFKDLEPRRIVLFATHGSSPRWNDRRYARLLKGWCRGSKVALLHLRAPEHWKRGALGEPHGLAHTEDPSAVSSSLLFESFWWKSAPASVSAIPLSMLPLEPEGLENWAHMQMARGRRCPAVLLEAGAAIDFADRTPGFLSPVPGESRPPAIDIPRREASPRVPFSGYELSVALLREASPEAFRLAVNLCSGAFTIPVARLVQEVTFGVPGQQDHLAEILLSGLVFAHTPPDEKTDPNQIYYEFHPGARAVLLRSLTDADTALVAQAMEQRLSEYIEAIHGQRESRFTALLPDENGRYHLPQWAQPFARLRLTALGIAPQGRTAHQLVEDFQKRRPDLAQSTAQFALRAPPEAFTDPDELDRAIWKALLDAGLARQDSSGTWSFLPGVQAILGAQAEKQPLAGVWILWIDDRPENNTIEVGRLREMGAVVMQVDETEVAIHEMGLQPRFNVIISDMTRGTNDRAGFDILRELQLRSLSIPTIIYAGFFGSSPENRRRAVRAGAYGCTNRMNTLINLTLEAAGRSAYEPTLPRYRELLLVLESLRVRRPRDAIAHPENLAAELLRREPDPKAALVGCLDALRAFAKSDVNQVVRVEGRTLRVVASWIAPEKTRSGYTTPDWGGLIGRAAKSGHLVWVPNVDNDSGYLRAEPDTRSELVVPLNLAQNGELVGVVNLEMDEPDALKPADIEWIERFCAPMAQYVQRLAAATAPRARVIVVPPPDSFGVVNIFEAGSDVALVSRQIPPDQHRADFDLPAGSYQVQYVSQNLPKYLQVEIRQSFKVERTPDVIEVVLTSPREEAQVTTAENAPPNVEREPPGGPKELIFCADDFWVRAEVGDPGVSAGSDASAGGATNVAKLFAGLAGSVTSTTARLRDRQEKIFRDSDGRVRQLARYMRGAGDSADWVMKMFAGVYGAGLLAPIVRAYAFISENYLPGDRIHLVGFSRGAYTVRALAGMIAARGLLNPHAYDTDDRTQAYQRAFQAWIQHKERSSRSWRDFLQSMTRTFGGTLLKDSDRIEGVPVSTVAVWETIGSMGIPRFAQPDRFAEVFAFTDLRLSPAIGRAYHAMALDERRRDFPVTRWEPDPRVEEVWFSGAHGDVGGGYSASESGLSDIALEWMIERLESHGLLFPSNRTPGKPDPLQPIHRPWEKPPFNIDPKPRAPRSGDTFHLSVYDRLQKDSEYRRAWPGLFPSA